MSSSCSHLSSEAHQLLHQGDAKAPPNPVALAKEAPKAGGSKHLALRVMRLVSPPV